MLEKAVTNAMHMRYETSWLHFTKGYITRWHRKHTWI